MPSLDRAMSASPLVLTIGNFDGVHLGHHFLINTALQTAKNRGFSCGIMTFWPHPRTILKNSVSHKSLTTREERLALLKRTGADPIIEIPFNMELAKLSPREFVQQYLLPLNVKHLVIGHDFTLGHKRSGTESVLRALGEEYHIDILQAPAYTVQNQPVSSTRLRAAITDGNMELASRMLGRFYKITGKVVRGMSRGAKIGFPTANLEGMEALLPKRGVYAAVAHYGSKNFMAVTNIGMNPTFNNDSLSVETHILDTSPDLYGQQLSLEFVKFLRPEQKFTTVNDLTSQIAKDVELTRQILATAPC